MQNYKLMNEAERQIKEQFERYNEGLISDEEAMYAIKAISNAVWNKVECLYYCVWGEGYMTKEPETRHISDFSASDGYSPDDFRKIADLGFGEAVTFTECGIHTVVRIK